MSEAVLHVIDNLSVAVECVYCGRAALMVKALNLLFGFKITTLICQNKFIYENQYNVLFLFVK